MASLDAQGIISAITIALYAPILFFALRTYFKYRARERAWIFLFIFSLIRIVGGALLVAAESVVPAVTGLYIGGYALEAPGSSPLLLSGIGLIEIVTEGEYQPSSFVFISLHIVGIVALVLTIVGVSGSSFSSSGTTTERCVSALLVVGLYIGLVAVTVHQWVNRHRLMKYRKQSLGAVAKSIPLLGVLALNTVLSAFSLRSFVTGDSSSTPEYPWAYRFSVFSTEYQVVLIYVWAGSASRIKDQDSELQRSEDYPLYPLLADSPGLPILRKWFCC